MKRLWIILPVIAAGLAVGWVDAATNSEVNSIGIELVRVAPGSFEMGVDSLPLPKTLTAGANGVIYDRTSDGGDYDETPVHKVTITQPYWMGASEVTIEQYRKFRPAFAGDPY